jgi:hypothetical protein
MTRQPRRPANAESSFIPGWVSAIVVLGALLTAAGGIVAQVRPTLLLSAGERMSAAADVYAGYLVSRNLALAIMLVATLLLRARRTLAGLMMLTALIQVIDAIVDAAGGRSTLVPGVLVLGVAFLAGAARLSPRPLWRPESWRDPARPEAPLGATGDTAPPRSGARGATG